MSYPHQNLNVPNPEIGVDQYPPQYPPHSAQNQAPRGVSDFADGSGQIFSMYLDMATEEDKRMVENWKADADGILIFTGLFSAAVATLISVSIQDIRQNPQDTSNFYLANIHQTLADPNRSTTSTIPPPSLPPFSPPNHAVWVNALWFMSLVISLTCALLATLLQQWARRYLKITQSRYSPHKRARIRAFFSEGVEKCLLPWTVDALPTLLHISLFLFFAGLVVFLCNVHLTIFKFVLSWVGICTALYGCITCMPIFRHDSPYYTPLSLPVWHIVTGIPFLVYRFLRWFGWSVRSYYAYYRFRNLEKGYRQSLLQGMQKTAEEIALNLPSEIDTRAFMWTFDCLDEDHELEYFFSGLPGFRSSKVVHDPFPSLTEEEMRKLYGALDGLLYRTFSSDLLPAPVKDRRAMICAKALDPDHTPNAFSTLEVILSQYQHSGPVATRIAKVLSGWGTNMDEDKILYARIKICKVIATRQPYDDSWYIVASNELGLPETSLRDYAAQGDSLSLVILIHVVRRLFTHFGKPFWWRYYFSPVLWKASRFNVKDTSAKLQHEFCALWNQIVNKAQDCNDRDMAFYISRPIRNVYLALHQDTDSAPTEFSASTGDRDIILSEPSSYPVCKVAVHRSDSTPHIHDDGVSMTLERAMIHDPNFPAFVPFLTSPDLPSSSTHAPLPVNETTSDARSLDNQISVQGSTQPIGQTTSEGRRIPTISLTPITPGVMHGSTDPSKTTQPSTSSPSPKKNTSASPPAGVAVGFTELSRALSDDLNVQPLPSPTPVLETILPTESHPSIQATAAGGEARPAVHTATTDLPSQLPSPPPGTDTVTDGPSTHSLGTEHTEHRLPDAIVVEQTAVGQTPSSDIEVPSSPSPTPVLGDFLPIESRSQMLAPAASGPSCSWDPSAAVEGEASAEAASCQKKGKDEPREEITITSDVPTRLLPPQPIVDVAIAGLSRTSSRGSLDTGKYPSRPHGQYDIV